MRKKIVATTEGGAITGEERLREHTDQLYGAILSYEGKPGAYQMAYIDTLKLVAGRSSFAWLPASPVDFPYVLLRRIVGENVFKGRFLVPKYFAHHPSFVKNRHATEMIAELLNVRLVSRKLQVFLTEAEEDEAREHLRDYENPVAIHITSNCCESQNWPVHKWESLVRRNPQYTFIQLGLSNEVPIEGAIDLRGRLPIRKSIAILKYVKSFVGVVSCMAHATSAVNTHGVVLFGPSTPLVWAHENNLTITRNLRCAPCVEYMCEAKCPYGAPCLNEISVAEVEEALYYQLRRFSSESHTGPLATQQVP